MNLKSRSEFRSCALSLIDCDWATGPGGVNQNKINLKITQPLATIPGQCVLCNLQFYALDCAYLILSGAFACT